MRVIDGLDEALAAVGSELGVTDWHDVTQARVEAFAHATGDLNFLHLDPERARETVMGGTIAHGLYTLSLGPMFLNETVRFEGLGLGVNYGYDRVRFCAPLPVGSRVRLRCSLAAATPKGRGVELRIAQVYEREGADKPVCVADWLVRYLG